MCGALCKIHCTTEGMKRQLKEKYKVFLSNFQRNVFVLLVAVTTAHIFLLSRW